MNRLIVVLVIIIVFAFPILAFLSDILKLSAYESLNIALSITTIGVTTGMIIFLYNTLHHSMNVESAKILAQYSEKFIKNYNNMFAAIANNSSRFDNKTWNEKYPFADSKGNYLIPLMLNDFAHLGMMAKFKTINIYMIFLEFESVLLTLRNDPYIDEYIINCQKNTIGALPEFKELVNLMDKCYQHSIQVKKINRFKRLYSLSCFLIELKKIWSKLKSLSLKL